MTAVYHIHMAEGGCAGLWRHHVAKQGNSTFNQKSNQNIFYT